MLHEVAVSRLQGRKTLASPPGTRPRERSPREEKPTANDDATPAPQARVEDGNGRIGRQTRGPETSRFRQTLSRRSEASWFAQTRRT
jgi:hypothetical protein